MRLIILIFSTLYLVLFLWCQGQANKSSANNWKSLNLKLFSISVPNDWIYQPQKGEDSFVGIFKTQKSLFAFDYSTLGFANHLTPTVKEYLDSEDWLGDCPLYKVGVTYTAQFNVRSEKLRQMKDKGLTDSTLVKVEPDPCFMAKKNIHLPTQRQHNKYPNANYVADLVFKSDTTYIAIQIPKYIADKNIQVDTIPGFIVKTIWPKIPGHGLTGIYIRSRKSNLNFNLSANNLSETDQKLALRIFKTIKLKE